MPHISKRTSLLHTLAPGLMATATLGALTLVGASGCDTLAQITFDDRSFEVLQVVGLTPDAGMCAGSDGSAQLRFVMIDGDDLPISNETVLANARVNLTRNSVDVETPTYFEYPGVACMDNGDCSEGSGFACDSAPNDDGNLCQINVGGVSVSSDPRFASPLDKTQVFAVLVENTASVSGSLPDAISRLTPDYREGSSDGGKRLADDLDGNSFYKGETASRASDPNNSRKTAVNSMRAPWTNVATNAKREYQVRTFFGSWLFDGSSGNLKSTTPTGALFVEEPAQVGTSLDNLNSERDGGSVANVYESILALIEDPDKLKSFASSDGIEKYLIVVVDGPDDLREDSSSKQKVIEAAQAEKVRIFFVHYDPEVTTQLDSGVPLLPDLPGYAVSQDMPCQDLDEAGDPVAGSTLEVSSCKNFEECRRVTAYAAQGGKEVTQPAGRLEDAYCAIARDENGRIGPIDEYAEIACATGGGYMYYPETGFLSNKIGFLPYIMDGLWETDLTLDAYGRDALQPGQAYSLDTSVQVTVGGNQRGKTLRQGSIYDDERRVLFKAPTE